MKSKFLPRFFLILLFCLIFQKSNSQSYSSYRFNSDSVIFDGSSINLRSGCNGKVSNIRGCAKIEKPSGECGVPGSSSNAGIGDNIEAGNTIKVCPNSMVEVTMPDGSVIRSGSNSEMNLTEASCEQQRNFSFRLTLGAMWQKVMPYVGGDTRYEVQTENAVTGVRGTQFMIKVGYDTVYDNSERTVFTINTSTTVIVLEGEVEVWNKNRATLTDTLTMVSIAEDFRSGKITVEEFQARMEEINNNYKMIIGAGMETTIYGQNPPTPPRRTRLTAEDFLPDNMLNK